MPMSRNRKKGEGTSLLARFADNPVRVGAFAAKVPLFAALEARQLELFRTITMDMT